MIQSIAIQAYFAQMRHFFTRQGFDTSMKVVYGADAQGNLDLLDKDLANKDMPHKQGTDRESVRSNPYTYLFWTKGSPANIVRRPVHIRDGLDPGTGAAKFRKTVSTEFTLSLAFISNKGNTVEDFEEAFAAEWQNMHTVPLSMKWAFPAESELTSDDYWISATAIQDLGQSEMVSYRPGNLFAYTWTARILLSFMSEFADRTLHPLKSIVVDLYNENGVPLASMDAEGQALWTAHVATDGTEVTVPEVPYFEKSVLT